LQPREYIFFLSFFFLGMLEQLFGSKTRTKLLRIFLLNPENTYFIRELTRKIDTQINSVRRELQNLVTCGIIMTIDQPSSKKNAKQKEEVSEKDAKGKKSIEKLSKKYFQIRKDFLLYNELRLLFTKSPLLLRNEFLREVPNLGSIDYAIMTGFFVSRDDIPVDILIVGTVEKNRLHKLIQHFEQQIEREINFSTMTTEEFTYRKSLTDRFLFSILEGKKIVVIDKLKFEGIPNS